MFQSAYAQISSPERSFVDMLVRELKEAARRLGQRISLALGRPLPQAIIDRDTKGYLQRPLVRAAINEQVTALALEEEINPANWIREVHAIAHANIGDILQYDEVGDPYFDLDGAPRDLLAAVASVEVEKSDGLTRSSKTKIKIKMHDKLAALKMEAAYMGLDDGDNPHRRADKAAQQVQLTENTTPEAAAEAYSQMIGD